jgi:hypothetical protein
MMINCSLLNAIIVWIHVIALKMIIANLQSKRYRMKWYKMKLTTDSHQIPSFLNHLQNGLSFSMTSPLRGNSGWTTQRHSDSLAPLPSCLIGSSIILFVDFSVNAYQTFTVSVNQKLRSMHSISPNSKFRWIAHGFFSDFDVSWLFRMRISHIDRKSPCLDHIRMAIANPGRSWVSPHNPALLSECSDRQDQIKEMMANSIRVNFVDLGRSLTRTTLQLPTLILIHDLVAHGFLGE